MNMVRARGRLERFSRVNGILCLCGAAPRRRNCNADNCGWKCAIRQVGASRLAEKS